MGTQEQYVTITHYKEREFYFLSYAIQTKDGIIPKDIEQFHESDKIKFIERIRQLQSQYPNNHIVSISLLANQSVSEKEDRNRASAKILKNNYVIQENIDVGDIPTTLYFSPFTVLYQQYKDKLDDKVTLIIGLFDRKLFMMFATNDKIHQSWTIGTRGLTEKQVAERVYKSMQAYYKISYSFADHLEMLVSDDSPKLLKVLREELSMHIHLSQQSIHNLLHGMASTQESANSSYIKSFRKIELNLKPVENIEKIVENRVQKSVPKKKKESLNDIKLDNKDSQSKNLFAGIKSLFAGTPNGSLSVVPILPLFAVLVVGGFFSMKNSAISDKLSYKNNKVLAHQKNIELSALSERLFKAMGKNAELKKATLSTDSVDIKGIVWGIEPLKNSLNELYKDGKFVIKPLENFMTEFSFSTK